MKIKIELETPNKIIAEITYKQIHKRNKLIQWYRIFLDIWKFEFKESKQELYHKKYRHLGKEK